MVIAVACQGRRNRRRLQFHQRKARDEFVGLILRLALSRSNDSRIIGLALQTSNLINDKDASEKVSEFLPSIKESRVSAAVPGR